MYSFKHIEMFYLAKAHAAVGMKNKYDMEDVATCYNMATELGVVVRSIGWPTKRELREAT